jgi:hypothetical protein
MLLFAAFTVAAFAYETPHQHGSPVTFSVKPNDTAAHAWSVKLDASGAGTYTEASETDSAPRPVTVSAATMARLHRGERAVKSDRCGTKLKNVVKTGEKTIRYELPGGAAECTFDYADDNGLMDTATAFQQIAATMQEGERLEHEHRYDRLALDAEMETLVNAAHGGTMIELENIAPVLQSLVADEHVIDRVRREAARLLQDAGFAVPVRDADVSAR